MFFAIFLLSPLRKGCGPLFEQTWIPITQGCFVLSLDKIGPVVLEKSKIEKVYRQTDRRTDRRTEGQTNDGRQAIRKAHLSFQLRWAKNYLLERVHYFFFQWREIITKNSEITLAKFNSSLQNQSVKYQQNLSDLLFYSNEGHPPSKKKCKREN